MSRKRQREVPNIDVQLVETYEDLANENEEIRLKAAHALVSKLSPENAPTSEQLEKTLNRLIRGLSSGRKAARLGFSIALTEILSQLLGPDRKNGPNQHITIDRVLEILKNQTHAGGSVSGQEERDRHFGRLFGSEAIIKSSILFVPTAPIEHWEQVLDSIYALAKKKPWLREECGWIIFEATQLLASQTAAPSYAQLVIDELHSNGLAKTPEGVAIWLRVQSSFPTVKLPKGVWYGDNPLHAKEVRGLAKVLKEVSHSKESENGAEVGNERGMWYSNLHFIWDVVLADLFLRESSPGRNQLKASKHLTFVDFWTEVVDNSLFSASASDERKYWGFTLASKAIREAPKGFIAPIFSPNFMRCLINQLALPERFLHRIALKVLKAIHSRAEAEPGTAPYMVHGLMGSHGFVNFDQATKTKTVERLMVQSSMVGLHFILGYFELFIRQPGVDEEKAAESRRQLLADQLLSVVRSRNTDELGMISDEHVFSWIDQVFFVLVKFGYFVVGDMHNRPNTSPFPPLSKATQSLFRSRISSCLVHLTSNLQGATFPYTVVRTIRVSEDDQSLFQADDTVRRKVNRAWKLLEKIHTKATSAENHKRAYLKAFEVLYSLTILQVYNGDTDAVLVLDELKTCYDSMVKHRSAENDEASELFVEVLLSFISKPSVLFRRMVEQVFTTFSSEITAAGLQAMMKVLETKESLAGQQEMFDEDDEVASEAEDDDISDVVEANGVSDNEEEDSELDGAENAPSGSDDAASGVDEELAAFDSKLAEALGTHRADNDMDANGDTASSDEDMDDEQMEALDVHLETIFKERKKVANKKTEKKDAVETIVNFKLRVLDLLQIYIKQQHTNALVLDLVSPLLQLIRTTSSKQVSEKGCNVVRQFARLCKGKAVPEPLDIVATWISLQQVHKEAERQSSHAHGNACSQMSLLLVKVLVGLDRGSVNGVVEMYAETRKHQLLDRHCNVQPGFFSDFNNWCTSASKQLQK